MNFKFKSALKYLNNEPVEIQNLVRALADTYGNCGWIIGGTMQIIIENALDNINVY